MERPFELRLFIELARARFPWDVHGRARAWQLPWQACGFLDQYGEYWTIVYEGTVCRLKHTKGLHYLAQLLRHPGTEFHAIGLMARGQGGEVPAEGRETQAMTGEQLERMGMHAGGLGDAGEILDTQAKSAYKHRLHELDEELEEARTLGDRERVAPIEEEIETFAQQLASTVGLWGRDRRAGSPAERARLNVTRAVKTVMQKLAENNTALGQHLSGTVKTGTFCSYTPDPGLTISWTF